MEKELNLQDIVQLLLSKLVYIIIFSILGAIGAFTFSKYVISPKYQSGIQMYIKEQQSTTSLYQDIMTAQELINSYLVIIKSEVVCKEVAENLNSGFTSENIASMLSLSAVDDTEVFNVVVTHTDPNVAYDVACTLEKVIPLAIESVVEVENIKVIGHPKMPKSPSSPNNTKNAMLGFIGGALAVIAIVFVADMLDNKVKDAKDLQNRYNIPVIGMIPLEESEN